LTVFQETEPLFVLGTSGKGPLLDGKEGGGEYKARVAQKVPKGLKKVRR